MIKSTAQIVLALLVVATLSNSAVAAEAQKAVAISEPVKSVLDHYLAIQKELARDSFKGVEGHATAIAKAVKSDDKKSLPADVATQAETLAKAKDLKTAREADKPLSASLIKYLKDSKAGKGVYYEAYCPMAKASWLQTDKNIRNPYYGNEMLDCGEIKN